MPKFRKKPVVIEAVQYHETMRERGQLPVGVSIVFWEPDEFSPELIEDDYPTIQTTSGQQIVRDGDWIVTDAEGKRSLCKPDIFKATYEMVGR